MTNHPETPTNKTPQDVPGDPICDNYQDNLDVPIVSATPGRLFQGFSLGGSGLAVELPGRNTGGLLSL